MFAFCWGLFFLLIDTNHASSPYYSTSWLECGGLCHRLPTECRSKDQFCITDSYSLDPQWPCDGDDRYALSVCPVCQEGHVCYNSQCAELTVEEGGQCCNSVENSEAPGIYDACPEDSGLEARTAFCKFGLECVKPFGSVNGTCEVTRRTKPVDLQYDDACNDNTTTWKRCASNLMACHPVLKKCRYFNPSSCNKLTAWKDCPAGNNNWGEDPYGACSTDDDCKYGEYCTWSKQQSANACLPRQPNGVCDAAFRMSNSDGSLTTSLFTQACGHDKICLLQNPYGNQLETKAFCTAPFQGGEGAACVSGDLGGFYCQPGLRCSCYSNACMCHVPRPLTCADGSCNSYSADSDMCPNYGFNRVSPRICVPEDDGFFFEQWLYWKWTNGDFAFFNCLEQNKCQLPSPHSECAIKNNCVQNLKNQVTWRFHDHYFDGDRIPHSATIGVKTGCNGAQYLPF
eukprot:gb/GEZN01007890.1/.p1 GENE.gb/GEZN01007890.1/~~gb/GEZN01007890.1/.p1  ORF type:complete len:464 (+),score=2.88 gb/GEZN01007890.1/:27-1394(+)